MAEQPAAPTAPELVLETDIGSTVMSPSRDYHVGRDPESDIVIDDARVSWHHAVLHPDAGHWTLQDEASTNGTYTGGHRVHESGVGAGSIIHFGNPGDGPRAVLLGREPPARPATPDRPSAVSMPAAPGTFRQPTTVRPLPAKTVRIGRDAGNDLVIDDLVVSRHHAELRALPDGRHEIVDLGSHNGTFLNDQPVDRAKRRRRATIRRHRTAGPRRRTTVDPPRRRPRPSPMRTPSPHLRTPRPSRSPTASRRRLRRNSSLTTSRRRSLRTASRSRAADLLQRRRVTPGA